MVKQESLYQLSINNHGVVVGKDNSEFNSVEYSRFKYGSRTQADTYGLQLAYLARPLIESLALENIVVTSSAYKCVPTASAALTHFFVSGLNQLLPENRAQNVSIAKIDKIQVTPGDYGVLSAEKRSQRMKKGTYHIDPALFFEKHIVVVDDIRITGAHEQKIIEFLNRYPIFSLAFLYIASFDKVQAASDPYVEDRLNHAAVKNLNDLLQIIEADDCILNARICKFILAAQPEAMQVFLMHISEKYNWFLDALYRAVVCDGYEKMSMYKQQAHLIAVETRRRGLICGLS